MSQPTTDFDAFLRQRNEASDAFINGDIKPLDQISFRTSPATIFGPRGDCKQGAERVNAANGKGAMHFKPGSKNAFEILHKAADQNFAYCVGIQRYVVQMEGQKESVPFDLRVAEIFRRENGAWKVVHRHADPLKSNDAA